MMRSAFDRRVRRIGLTRSQWLVLSLLHRRPGVSQSELAEMLEVERATAGRMIDRLERKHWLVRRPDREDRRINRLYLTEDAKGCRRRWAGSPPSCSTMPWPPRRGRARGAGRDDGADEGPASIHGPAPRGAGRGRFAAGRRAMTQARRVLLRLALLVGVPLVVVAGGLLVWLTGGRYITTDNAYVRADIVQIAPEISGRVAEVAIRDHAQVATGALLFRIDPEPYRLALAKAEAELDTARTAVETARATYHETLSELGELESRADYLSRQARRQQELASRGVAPATRMEETQNDAQVARERINVVRQRLTRLLTTLKGDPELPVDEHPSVRERMAERDRAALDLARTTINAPIGGTIVNMRLQRGEQVRAATPVFALVSERRPWVEAI
ncbi:MarR family transcriptional regulator [Siccirubricoccus deserti]